MTTEQAPARHKTVLDDDARQVGRVYAEALYKAAEKQNASGEVLDDLNALVDGVFDKDPGLELFFGSASVSEDKKAAAIKSAFEGRATSVFADFLGVLNAHGRMDMLRPIALAYRTLHDRKTRKVVVHVRSAIALDDAHRDRLRDDVRAVAGIEPILHETIDPDILGGLIVRIQDWVYDASVRTRLATVRNELIERSSHGIQSGRDRFSP